MFNKHKLFKMETTAFNDAPHQCFSASHFFVFYFILHLFNELPIII